MMSAFLLRLSCGYLPYMLLLAVLLSAPVTLSAQYRHVSVGFYNVENLFDTVPSPFYDDREYTPEGRNGWNTERYRKKLTHIARVIEDAGFDVAALAEVENEEAVRDLVSTLSDDYSYIHRTSSDTRGIDIALLYKGDKFFPGLVELIRSGTTREFLFVKGELIGVETGFLVCHLPSKFNGLKYREAAAERLAVVADSLVSTTGCARLIVMGDFNGELCEGPMRKAFGKSNDGYHYEGKFYDALYESSLRGYGTYCWDGSWLIYDNILVSRQLAEGDGMRLAKGGIFLREYMLTRDESAGTTERRRRGYPLRTFTGGRYLGGYSDHLPVFAVFTR